MRFLIFLCSFLAFSMLFAKEKKRSILIKKNERMLFVFQGKQLIARYKIALGKSPKGDKQREGDGKTPEGTYRVCTKNPKSRFYLSLGINYPNAKDATKGLNEGLINQTSYQAILYAQNKGIRPPWDTPLGGEIFIHGAGNTRDWTLGCIALDNKDMRELYEIIPLGCAVQIVP